MAAIWSAANTKPACYTAFITDANLTQFDTGSEDSGEVFNEFTEIDSVFRGKVEKEFIVIESAFNIDKVHIEFSESDFLFADFESVFFLGGIFFEGTHIVFSGESDDRFK